MGFEILRKAMDACGRDKRINEAIKRSLAALSTLITDLTAVVTAIVGLPSQTGNSGKYLTTDGSNPSWGTITIPSLTVEDIDSNPTYTAITTLRFDQADGFTLSNPSAGIARVDWALSGGITNRLVKWSSSTVVTFSTLGVLLRNTSYSYLSFHEDATGIELSSSSFAGVGAGTIDVRVAYTVQRICTGSPETIHGMNATAVGHLQFVLAQDSTVTIKHESGSATAADRFNLPGAADVVLAANEGAVFVYTYTGSGESGTLVGSYLGELRESFAWHVSAKTAKLGIAIWIIRH